MPQPRLQFLLCLLVYTLIVRLLPYVLMNCDIQTDPSVLYYPWNFSPLTAVCLFGGAFLADRRMSFVLPLAIVLMSDIGIAAVSGRADWAFPVNEKWEFEFIRLGAWATRYLSFSLAVAAGCWLRNWKPRHFPAAALATGLTYEVLFFGVSNFMAWWMPTETQRYPFTAAGLFECYVAALPFFGKSLLGTAAFTALLFSPLGVRAATEADGESSTGELARIRVK